MPSRNRRGDEADDDRDDVRVLTAVEEKKPELPPQYRFLAHNRSIREKIENWRTRVRNYALGDLDQALAEFYARHITDVSSLHDLNRLLRDPAAQERLCITEAELAGGQSLGYDAEAFPDAVPVSGQPVALAYAYAPGEEHDGVTIELPFSLAQTASSALIEWAVPGLREEMISGLLRALPKSIRRELMPFPPKVTEIVREFQPTGTLFLQDFAAYLHRRYGVPVKATDWPANALPAHLRPRIEIVDHERKSLGTGRDLAQLQQRLKQTKPEPVAKVRLRRLDTRRSTLGTVWPHGLDLRRSARTHHGERRAGPAGVCLARNRVCRRRRERASLPQSGPRACRLAGRRAAARGTRYPEGSRLAGKGFARLEPLRCALRAAGRQRRVAGNRAGTSEAPPPPD